MSDREPALPYRVIRTPDTEGEQTVVPSDDHQAQTSSTGIATADVAPSQVMPLSLLSAAASIASGTQAQQHNGVTDSARESAPGDSEPSQTPDEPIAPPRACADAAATIRSAEPAHTAMPLVASLTEWTNTKHRIPQAASAAWPASTETPVKTFVPAQHDDSRSTSGATPELQARPTSALSTFMAQHDAELPAVTPRHGDALLGGSDLSPVVAFVPPSQQQAAAGMAAESPRVGLLTEGDNKTINVTPAEHATSVPQPQNFDEGQAAAQADARGRSDSAEPSRMPTPLADAAIRPPAGSLPQNDLPQSKGAAPHPELTGGAAVQPGQDTDEAMTLLDGAETSSGAPAQMAGQPAWTLLPPNPEGNDMALLCVPAYLLSLPKNLLQLCGCIRG